MEFINILLPVYNEQARIVAGVGRTVDFFAAQGYTAYRLTIVDNASTDRTPDLGRMLARRYPRVHYLRIAQKGVGAALRCGAQQNRCPVIGYMDIDLSTDISHLNDVISIFTKAPDTALVNGSRLCSGASLAGRKWYRMLTTHGLVLLLKASLGMRASDAVCGFKFFSRPVLESLMVEAGAEDGWFYVIELLLRAERHGYKIVELPVRWQDDLRTTVQVPGLVLNYMTNIRMLRQRFRREGLL